MTTVTSLGWIGGTLTVATQGVGLGAGDIEDATEEFGTIAIPWSLLAVIVLVTAAVLGVLFWVRRSRRRANAVSVPAPDAPAPEPTDAAAEA